jgi:hypothetical protein
MSIKLTMTVNIRDEAPPESSSVDEVAGSIRAMATRA